jgi:hypothetical protein
MSVRRSDSPVSTTLDQDTAQSTSNSMQTHSPQDDWLRSHLLYRVLPSDDGYYHCPFAATENCGHEPKQMKSEYE